MVDYVPRPLTRDSAEHKWTILYVMYVCMCRQLVAIMIENWGMYIKILFHTIVQQLAHSNLV